MNKRIASIFCLASLISHQGVAQLDETDRTDELELIALFAEVVQIASQGNATDVSFVTTGYNVIKPNDLIWISDPHQPGITAIASRPILDTAKAGETLGLRGKKDLRNSIALEITNTNSFVLQENGQLKILRRGWTDSLQVGTGIVAGADVAVSASGIIYVLWGDRIKVYADPPSDPLWQIELPADLLPAKALSVSAKGEIYVVGEGERSVQVFTLNSDGQYIQSRAKKKAELRLQRLAGMSLSPKMLLPVTGKEGWVDEDRFVYLSDAESNQLLVLESESLELIGTWNVRQEVPFASPGRIDISNRGQIAFVDSRTNEAYVLPTKISVALVGEADFTWRIIDAQELRRRREQKARKRLEASKKKAESGG